MDLIQDFQDSGAEHQFNDATIKQKYTTTLAQKTESDGSDDSGGSFDCNICFDSARDPVVTLCGHLYCWTCIFKWLQVKRSSQHSDQSQACPVCKADITQATLIPLYCHGPSHTESIKHPTGDFIPPRPTMSGLQTLFSSENTNSNQQLSTVPYRSQPSSSYLHQQYISTPIPSSSDLVGPTMSAIINPMIRLIGDLVYATNPLPGSYAIIEHTNSRSRRHEIQMHKSLNRVSIFLFCCCILCLLLF